MKATLVNTIVTLALILASVLPLCAQELTKATGAADKTPPLPLAGSAQQLLLAAYPELRDRRIEWVIGTAGTAVTLEAREALPPQDDGQALRGAVASDGVAPQAAPAGAILAPLVHATAELDADGQIVTLAADGLLPRPAAFTALQKAPDLYDALRSAAARFPPDDPAGPKNLVPRAVLQVLGSADLPLPRFQGRVAGDADAGTWRVELTGTRNGSAHSYELVFEPVEGRLLSVVRR